eukprot:126340-Karenia_brevis.AAC.1
MFGGGRISVPDASVYAPMLHMSRLMVAGGEFSFPHVKEVEALHDSVHLPSLSFDPEAMTKMTELAQTLHSHDTCKGHLLALFYEYPKYGSVI